MDRLKVLADDELGGWSIASAFEGEWIFEPECNYPTRKEAEAALASWFNATSNVEYQAGYAYACGYQD